MIQLPHLSHVHRIAIQTKLSANLNDFSEANPRSCAFWTTFHPGQTPLKRFVDRCQKLDLLGLRYSVGVVGIREHFEALGELRKRLKREV